MIEPQLYTRNTHILPTQRTVTPGVRVQVQPSQGSATANASVTNVSASVELTVYPSRPVVDNVILAAQEAASSRRPQSYDVLPYLSSARDTQSQSPTPAPTLVQTGQTSQTHTPQSETAGPQAKTAGSNPSSASPPPSVPEFTRAQQAYTGAGAQDGRVFASSSPGETFYTGSRRTVDLIA